MINKLNIEKSDPHEKLFVGYTPCQTLNINNLEEEGWQANFNRFLCETMFEENWLKTGKKLL